LTTFGYKPAHITAFTNFSLPKKQKSTITKKIFLQLGDTKKKVNTKLILIKGNK